ncbi:Unknown protein sequence [Pseudomonas syringae pv. spinaceae]|uniref:Uncharacterized protein n=1 Tax=Pseudomonas syringae pv. spinaceae TaxID=264459 RepID=A0A0Q0C3A3_PSESX|nr:Unknown protein sequence [Pseudomonas syringae pv. spinaceae]
MYVSQVTEKQIYGLVTTLSRQWRQSAQIAIIHRQTLPGSYYINVVAFDGEGGSQLCNWHFGSAGEQLSGTALVIGRQMQHHHERHSVVGRHVLKEVLSSLQPACRGANAYDWEIKMAGLDILALRAACARVFLGVHHVSPVVVVPILEVTS